MRVILSHNTCDSSVRQKRPKKKDQNTATGEFLCSYFNTGKWKKNYISSTLCSIISKKVRHNWNTHRRFVQRRGRFCDWSNVSKWLANSAGVGRLLTPGVFWSRDWPCVCGRVWIPHHWAWGWRWCAREEGSSFELFLESQATDSNSTAFQSGHWTLNKSVWNQSTENT